MRRAPEDESRRWLEQAQEDLRWTEHLAQQGAFHIASFLAQQVAGKALKAYLYFQGEELVLGHSVERLAAQCAGYDGAFGARRPAWAILDAYYVSARYPNALPDSIPARVFDQATADRAVAFAREVVEVVADRMRS